MTSIDSDYSWKKISGLKLRLAEHTQIVKHTYRGQKWYVLHDRLSTRYYRFNSTSYSFLKELDGNRTIQQIVDDCKNDTQFTALTENDIIQLLAQLHFAEILEGDIVVDGTTIHERKKQKQSFESKVRWLSPLSIRFPLADPDRLLNKLLPAIQILFTKTTLYVWLALIITGVVIGIDQSDALVTHWTSRMNDPQNFLALCLVYPIVKALHELSHAAATKMWGGEVHEVGILLLVLMPMPFVDASASCVFSSKWRRMIVGASGIMMEMLLAAIGIIVWLNSSPGILQDMAFNVAFIGSVSTLLFNGNPLLRFDGYFVLMDLIEIPNLGQRSTTYLSYLIKRYLFGMKSVISPVTAAGERMWFVVYGIAAFFYRIFISIVIALFVASQYFFIGVVLATWALLGQMVIPLLRNIGFLFTSPQLIGCRKRAISVFALSLTLIITTAGFLSLPSWTTAEGLIALPDNSAVTAGSSGFITRVYAADGEFVTKGAPLFELEDSELPSRISGLNWRLNELAIQQRIEFMHDRSRAGLFQEEINQVSAELSNLQEQQKSQIVFSANDGVFSVAKSNDTIGRYKNKGDLLGYVFNTSADVTARVIIPQQAADRVRRDTEAIEVRLVDRPGTSISGTIKSEVPLINNYLPDRMLGTQGGGAIAVDARDSSGKQALDQIYQLDITLPNNIDSIHFGSKVYVRFDHHPNTFGRQFYQFMRQSIMTRFEI